MELKKPLSFEEQINKLKSHGMIVADEDRARVILAEVNYYRFTGYALEFRKNINDSDYIEGLSFEEIYQIYRFEEDLRAILRKFIEIVEVYYRTQIAYGFSMEKCKNVPYDQHYDEKNFYNKQGYKEVMESLQKEKNYYKDSLVVQHHKEKYDSKMPLWVIVELMSFSNLSKLYRSMYISEKEKIASEVGVSHATLENHLHCLVILRNKCAHAARLYNVEFNPPARFTKQFLKKNKGIKNNTLFAYLLILLKRLPNMEIKKEMIESLKDVIEKYDEKIKPELIRFPNDFTEVMRRQIN